NAPAKSCSRNTTVAGPWAGPSSGAVLPLLEKGTATGAAGRRPLGQANPAEGTERGALRPGARGPAGRRAAVGPVGALHHVSQGGAQPRECHVEQQREDQQAQRQGGPSQRTTAAGAREATAPTGSAASLRGTEGLGRKSFPRRGGPEPDRFPPGARWPAAPARSGSAPRRPSGHRRLLRPARRCRARREAARGWAPPPPRTSW